MWLVIRLSGTKACFFSSFLLFRIMCVKLSTLQHFVRRIPSIYGFWSWGFGGLGVSLTTDVCIVPLVPAMIIMGSSTIHLMVRDDPKLPGDSGEAPISEWSGWRFDSHCEIFSLLDGEKIKLSR